MENDQDLKGLPDVDLSPIIKDLKIDQDKDKKVESKIDIKPPSDLGQFKTVEDLMKSYKEIQAAFTKVSQESKSFKDQLSQLNEQLELAKLSNQSPVYHPSSFDEGQDPDFNKYIVYRISEILEEESAKDRTNFNERYAYAQMVSREYPQLAKTATGVKKLFELGDKLRTEQLKKSTGKALETLFGEPLTEEQIAKLRALVKGDTQIQNKIIPSNAYMPDTSTSTKTGADQSQKPNLDMKIKDSVDKGDVDGVIKGIFDSVLAK